MKLQTLIFIIIFFISCVELKFLDKDPNEALAFRLIHINDIHAHFDQVSEMTGRCRAEDEANGDCYGGVARLKTAVDEIRNLEPEMDSIFLNAGDYYQVNSR